MWGELSWGEFSFGRGVLRRLCVKAVTEPDSAESTEITDRARAESTESNGKLRFSDTGI